MSSAQENSTPAFKKPAKPERVYDLNKISNDDVIKFFRKDKALRKYWQQIMATDRHNSKFQRHVNCLTARDKRKIRKDTNFSFLKEPKAFETDIWTTLSEIVSKILSAHPNIEGESYETKKHYAENVLIPEGIEKYLIHKFNMSEAQAKKCYQTHHIIKCDYCNLYFTKDDSDNKDSDIDNHIEEVHKPSIDLENHIRDILEAPYVGTISEKEFQKRLKKYYPKSLKSTLSSRKEEINKLQVKVKNEIKKKKEAKAREQRLIEAQNHEEDDDFLNMDFE